MSVNEADTIISKETHAYTEQFRFLDREYALQNQYGRHYKRPVYSKPFQAFIDTCNELRREIGYERMTPSQAIERALIAERENGFEGILTRDVDGVDAQQYFNLVFEEIRKLGLEPNTSGCYGTHDHTEARNEFEAPIIRDLSHLRNILSLKPLYPLRLDFDTVVGNAVNAGLKAAMTSLKGIKTSASDVFNAHQIDPAALRQEIERIVEEAIPVLEEKDILIERGPAPRL